LTSKTAKIVHPFCPPARRLNHVPGDVEALSALLRERYETSIVPGRFFEMPQHFRMGIDADTPAVAEGLERLGAALDQLAG